MTRLRPGIRNASAALLLAILSEISYAQQLPDAANSEIVTDRPDVTESSIVVPKGTFQMENGLTWTTDHGFQTFDLSESLMRFGVSARTEIRLVVPNYLGEITGPDPTGFGDVALGMKQQLGPLPGGFDLDYAHDQSFERGSTLLMPLGD